MTKGNLKIHSENILPIIKKWLYSDKDIFVRELVSNACDAIQKVKVLREQGKTEALDEEFRIEISIDKEKKELTFTDTGIGMTAAEVEKYIAEIAFSGAEEFLKKYSTEKESDQIIGHFGLGFFSSYMVAEKVTINTLSFEEGAKPVKWVCDGTSEYEISTGTREKRGTEITLHVMPEEEEFLEEAKISTILTTYCSFLPYPIFLNGTQINKSEPLWMKAPGDCEEQEYLDFYKQLHPMEPAPLFWIHLNVDYPFHLKGILYFPHITKDYDFRKSHLRLFCNRVFVSDNVKDLVPDYLLALRGVIDSPDIPLNVSRSYLQMDSTVRQLSSHVSKKVSDRLSNLYKTDKEKYLSFWKDIEVLVKLGAMQDDKFFQRLKDALIWKNDRNEWTTAEEYLERNKEKHENKLFYSLGDEHPTQVLELYKAKEIEVLHTSSVVDMHFISFLEQKLAPAKFQRIDSSLDEQLLDKNREQTLLDAEGKTAAGKLADLIRSKLNKENVEVEAKSLANDTVPSFIMIDESSRRFRDTMLATNGQIAPELLNMGGKQTFVVNTNNPLISSLESLNSQNPELTKEVVNHVYDLALLSQKEMAPNDLNSFFDRSHHVIEKLTTALAKQEKAS